MHSSPPRVLAILPGFTASTLMDVVKPLLALEASGMIDFQVLLEPYTFRSAILWADLIAFCRNTEPKYQHILDLIQSLEIPYIYDLDDNLFEIPLDTELGRYHRTPKRFELLKRYLRYATLIRVYSQPLLERSQELNPNVQIMKAPLDWSLIEPGQGKLPQSRIKIVYVTSRKDDTLFSIFSAALKRLLSEFPDKISVYFYGFLPDEFRGISNVNHLKFEKNYDNFLRTFSQKGFDIGLAPLFDDNFHRSKTNNKYREYSACGIAGIYSNIEVYTSCVVNEKTGILVANEPDAWYDAMVRLITDAALRNKIQQESYYDVKQQYNQDEFQHEWWMQIQNILSMEPTRSKINGDNLSPTESPAPLNRGPSPSTSWNRLKFQQTYASLQSGGLKGILSTLWLQFNNILQLFKINSLGRL